MRHSRLPLAIVGGFVALGMVGGFLAVRLGLPGESRAVASGAPTSPAGQVPSTAPASPSVTPSSSASASAGSPGPSPSPSGQQAGVTSCPSPVAGVYGTLPTQAALHVALEVPVLMYHRIVPRSEAGNSLPSLVVPPEIFDQQLSRLDAAGWRTITLAELAADLARGASPPPKTFVVTFDDGYDDGYTYALPILQRHGYVGTFFIVPGRIGEPSILTTDHVKALAASGMEIADHTMSHANLPALDPAALRYQIGAAAELIAQVTGQPPTTFAYPFGDRDMRVVQQVAACGFEMAVTNVEGVRETWATRFGVPRLRVGPGTTPGWLLYLVSHPMPPAPPATPAPLPTWRPTPPPTLRPTPSIAPTPAPTVTPAPEATPTPLPSPSASTEP